MTIVDDTLWYSPVLFRQFMETNYIVAVDLANGFDWIAMM